MEFNGGTIVLICSLVLFPLGFFWRRLRSRGPSTPLRGPTSPSFLYGHALVLDSAEDPALVYEQWAEAYGSAFLVSVPLGKTRIVLTDPKAIAHFYSRVAYGYGRTRQQRMNVELLAGKGILWAEGDEHTRQRKVLLPAFTTLAVQEALPLVYGVASKLTAAWDELLTSNHTIVLDVQDSINRLLLDIIGITGFSHDFGTLQHKRSPIADVFHSFGVKRTSRLSSVIQILAFVFPPLMRLPTRRIRLLGQMKRASTALAQELLTRAQADLALEDQHGANVLGEKSMLALLARTHLKGADKEKVGSEDEIAAQAYLFSQDMKQQRWALIELCARPDMQVRLREELMTHCPSSDPSWEDISRSLPYLDAVIHEVLRLHPAVSETTRLAHEDDIIPLGSPMVSASGAPIERIHVARGGLVTVPIASINRSAAIWGEDAKLFNPERWLDDRGSFPPEASKLQGYRHLLTFADGPRTCLGRQFAVVELKVLLAVLLRRYAFALPDGPTTKIGEHRGFLPRPKVAGEQGSRVPMVIKRIE